MDAPREFTRDLPFMLERSDKTSDGLTLSGHAAVFNQTTRIDSFEGRFDEQIAPGAFKRTINSRTPVLMFEHGQHPLVGSMPIGQITQLREDRKGLYIEARLHDNWLIEPVRDAISSGSIDGMSFRFEAIQDDWDKGEDVPMRTLRELRVPELGPVVFPAYAGTDVGVRMITHVREALNLEDFHPGPAEPSTPEPHETPDPPAPEHSGSSQGARDRAFYKLGVKK